MKASMICNQLGKLERLKLISKGKKKHMRRESSILKKLNVLNIS